MEKHPYFDLWLHSGAELEQLLSAQIIERETLHEWPLSCVQRLRLAGGTSWIYKAQFSEGVEAAFYAAARSPLLVKARPLGVYQNTTALLLEAVDAPLLEHSQPTPGEALAHALRLEAAIARIGGDLPVYMDLGSPTRWQAFALQTCAKLEGLVVDGRFVQVTQSGINALRSWATSADVLAAADQPAFAHADLSGDNVLVAPGCAEGYRVIDWQYPRRLPAGYDRACLLDSLGFDPTPAVGPALTGVMRFVRLAWFTECQLRLFPQGNYGAEAAELIGRIV